ncbi:MAG: menaquinol-cytochrome C reductase [Chloroflexi bacterium]|nr:menaquinol-cytochrome C reductase [Chloroflexota bacterium]
MASERPLTGNSAPGPAGERRQAIAAAVRREGPASLKEQAERLVYTWPHLVIIEFIAAMLMLLSLIVMSWVVNAPLEGHADADKTPNPSKAPWYFLNLQELLLHMHPALAGVIVPGAVVFMLLPAIPYLDRDQRDVGKWFGTPNAVRIAIFTAIFTSIVIPIEIFFDEFVGVKPLLASLASMTGLEFLNDILFNGIILPMILMLGPIPVLLGLLRLRYKLDNVRDVMIALFTGFVVAYFLLTIVGTFFRGQGMHLYWPTDPRMERIE